MLKDVVHLTCDIFTCPKGVIYEKEYYFSFTLVSVTSY